jgi:hypothetical protein
LNGREKQKENGYDKEASYSSPINGDVTEELGNGNVKKEFVALGFIPDEFDVRKR